MIEIIEQIVAIAGQVEGIAEVVDNGFDLPDKSPFVVVEISKAEPETPRELPGPVVFLPSIEAAVMVTIRQKSQAGPARNMAVNLAAALATALDDDPELNGSAHTSRLGPIRVHYAIAEGRHFAVAMLTITAVPKED